MSVSMNREKRTDQPNKSDSMIFIKPKKKNEQWKKFSFLSEAHDGIDCGDKQCYLEYRVLPDCYLILETNNTNCRIPCIMDGCDTELHHFIPCPVWNCEPITTSTTTRSTTTTSSTTTMSTTTERPTPIEPTHMSPWIYSSIVLNVFFFAIICAYLVVKFRVWITIRLANFRAPTTTDTRTNPPNPNEHFSVGSNSDNESDINETQPLLPPVAKLARQEPIASPTTNALRQGYDNLGLHCANLGPLPSTSNWQELRQALLGGDGPIEQSQNPLLPSSSNWDDISLASPQTPEENNGASLNDVEANKTAKPEKSIFLLMKSFKKSK